MLVVTQWIFCVTLAVMQQSGARHKGLARSPALSPPPHLFWRGAASAPHPHHPQPDPTSHVLGPTRREMRVNRLHMFYAELAWG